MKNIEWEKARLENVVDVKGGKRLPKGEILVSEVTSHPYIRVTDMGSRTIDKNTLLYVPDKTFDSISRYIVNNGDIILSIVGTIGLVSKITPDLDKASLTENCVKLTDYRNINRDYLYYYLITADCQNEIRSKTIGTTQPKFPLYNIKSLEVPIPPMEVQKRIASILSSLDDKIELNRQIAQTLEAITQAIFKEWFVDFNFPGATSEMQEGIPVGWKKTTISAVASDIQYGYTQSSSQEVIGPKFLRITDIQGGTINWANVPFCKISDKDLEKYQIKEHDIFIARTGASTGENVYVVDSPEAVFASYLIRVQFGSPALASYTGKFLRTKKYFDYIASILSGSAQPNANAQQLTGIEILIPEKTLLEKYFQTVQPLDQLKSQITKENQDLSQLRDSLIPKLINGELKII